jgi:hypothetical protein
VSLAELVSRQDAYQGRLVVVEGTVRGFGEGAGAYYVVEDAGAHRVGLRPAAVAAPYVSRRVRAVGAFGFDAATGRFIAVTRIEPASRGGEDR